MGAVLENCTWEQYRKVHARMVRTWEQYWRMVHGSSIGGWYMGAVSEGTCEQYWRMVHGSSIGGKYIL